MRIAIALLITGGLLACSQETPEKEAAPATPIERAMARQADSLLQRDHFNSLSIGIYQDGETYTGHYGELDNGEGNTPTDSTIYEIASLTKTFTGTLLAKAELEGKIDLDDDIRNYLAGDYPNLAYANRPITIKDLATHTSRLPRELPYSEDLWANPNDSLPYRLNERAQGYTKAMFLRDLRAVELDTLPGYRFAYSNVGPELIAQILEKVYDNPFDRLLEEEIFTPAGMESTAFHLTEAQQQRFANGYTNRGELAPHFLVPLSGADGGLKSSLADLMKYMAFQFDENNPTVARSHELMVYDDGRDFGEGYYWLIRTDDELGTYYFCHGGAYGTQNYFFLIPDYKLGISVITNQSGPDTAHELIGVVNGLIEDLETIAGAN